MCAHDTRSSADECVCMTGCLDGLLRSVQRLDGFDRHQVLHGVGELPVERDQRVGVELSQGDVLGVKGVRPAEQAGGLPCDILEDAVPSSRIRSPRTYSSCRSASFLVISPRRTA